MKNNELNIEDFKSIMANPFYAINIAPTLAGHHKTMISKEEWVKIAIRNITEDDDGVSLGYDEALLENLTDWLHRLLDVLETDEVPIGYL